MPTKRKPDDRQPEDQNHADLQDLDNLAGACRDWAEVLTNAVGGLQRDDPIAHDAHVKALQRVERAVRDTADRITVDADKVLSALDLADQYKPKPTSQET